MTVQDTNNNVVARLADVEAMGDAAITGAEVFLDQLIALAALAPPTMEAPYAQFTPNALNIDATPPEHPSIEMAEAGVIPDEPSITTDFGVAFPTGLDDITLPTTQDFTFSEREYISDLLSHVKAKIDAGVLNGGTGLAASVEDDIYQRDAERNELAVQQNVDRMIDEWSGRGFSLPSGVIVSSVSDIFEKSRMDSLTVSREIRIKQAEMAKEHEQFLITNGISLETVLIAHHDRIMDRALQAATSILQIGIAIIEAQVRLIIGKIDIYKNELDARIVIEKFKLEKYAQAVVVYSKKIDAIATKANALTNLYQADTAVYSATIQKAEAYARLQVAQQEITVRNLQANLELAGRAAEANMRAYENTANVKIQAAQAGATVRASQLNGILGAISTVIQLASSGQTIATE